MNPEQKREYMRVWREKNREKIRMWDRNYYAENTEVLRERQKKYQLEHLDDFARRAQKWNLNNHAGCLLRSAKCRAFKKGIDFDIDITDIVIPDICPILGIQLKRSREKLSSGSATLDRIDNSLGYVKGNVWVISHKANLMKNNASKEELQAFANWVLNRSNLH